MTTTARSRFFSQLPRRACRVSVMLAAILAIGAPAGRAADGTRYGTYGQYGEVWRGSGFDAAAYDGGRYDKPLTPGKFLDPVGFAVDTADKTVGGDGTAIYVLDRTSNLPGNVRDHTSWRIQKLDDQGTVLGTDEFTLPADQNHDEMLSLSIDAPAGRVYALVVAFDPDNAGILPNGAAECALEILSWSTTPNHRRQLTEPSSLPPDALSHGTNGYPTPAVLSTPKQLIPGGNPQGGSIPRILAPQSMALDRVGKTDYLAVQGADGNSADLASGNVAGSGITQVCTIGPCAAKATGDVSYQWSANKLSRLPNDVGDSGFPPAGISTAPDGSLTILLDAQGGQSPSNLDVVDVPADLTGTPTIISSTANAVQNPDLASLAYDDAAVFPLDTPINIGDPDGTLASTMTASAQLIALSNGLYAGIFAPDPAGQADPQNPSGAPGIWTPHDPGIRLLAPEADGTLSAPAPPLDTLFDTLGNPAGNATGSTEAASACSMLDAATASAGTDANPMPSLASGAAGTIWVLTRGRDSSKGLGSASKGGRELIELAPNGAGEPCPAPQSTFTNATNGGTPVLANPLTPLTVHDGDTVDFDASTINNSGAAIAEYVWDFGDGTAPQPVLGAASPPFQWPSPAISHEYTAPGQYTVTLTQFGDFGEYVESGKIEVVSGTLPVASFTAAPAPGASMTVAVDGSASSPSPGQTIISYDWSWGDGQIDDTAGPADTHTYAAPGTYTVTLTVLDSAYAHSAPATQTVTVTSPPPVVTPPPPPPPPPGPPAITATFAPTATGGGRLAVVIACPQRQFACLGSIALAPAHGHRVLGRGSFTVAGSRSKLVWVRLTRAARANLRRAGRLVVTATVSARNPEGGTYVLHKRLTLRLAPRRARGRHHRGKRGRHVTIG